MLVKELPDHLRGRQPGEVPRLLEAGLRARGAREVVHVADEVEATREALAWARPGDLLLLLVHERAGEVIAMVEAEGGPG